MGLITRSALVAVILAAGSAIPTQRATAQTPSFDAPAVGARVRVSRAGAAPTTGTVLARSNDSIVVGRADGGRDTLAMKDVTMLAISRGRSRNVVVGTALGLVAGTVGGLLIKQDGDRVTTQEFAFRSTDPNNL